jgi:hypothetical protein
MWAAVSLPVVHARVPLPILRVGIPRMPWPSQATVAQGRWAAQAAGAWLPPVDRLMYYGGVSVMAVFGVLEWPVAAAAAAGVWVASRAGARARRGTPA